MRLTHHILTIFVCGVLFFRFISPLNGIRNQIKKHGCPVFITIFRKQAPFIWRQTADSYSRHSHKSNLTSCHRPLSKLFQILPRNLSQSWRDCVNLPPWMSPQAKAHGSLICRLNRPCNRPSKSNPHCCTRPVPPLTDSPSCWSHKIGLTPSSSHGISVPRQTGYHWVVRLWGSR